MRYFVVFGFAMLLAACGTLTEPRLPTAFQHNGVTVMAGMTEKQLIKRWGKPDKIKTGGVGMALFDYTARWKYDHAKVWLKNGHVRRIDPR